MSPAQEEQVCGALVDLGWLENDHALHAEGVRVICQLLGCSMDDAKAVLYDLRSRTRIDVAVTPDARLPVHVRWVRPPTA